MKLAVAVLTALKIISEFFGYLTVFFLLFSFHSVIFNIPFIFSIVNFITFTFYNPCNTQEAVSLSIHQLINISFDIEEKILEGPPPIKKKKAWPAKRIFYKYPHARKLFCQLGVDTLRGGDARALSCRVEFLDLG